MACCSRFNVHKANYEINVAEAIERTANEGVFTRRQMLSDIPTRLFENNDGLEIGNEVQYLYFINLFVRCCTDVPIEVY